MPPSSSSTLQVYRLLLRSINKNITSITGNREWIKFAQDQFRRHSGDNAEEQLQLAKDYAFMIDGVREHRELLLSYNVGIPVEDREKNMKKRAAALVGLALPPGPEHH